MPFADTEQTSSERSFYISRFVKLNSLYPTEIFILDDEAQIRWIHWLPNALSANRQRRGVGITCPGPAICPVCIRNAKIKAENPKNWRNHKEYRASRKRFIANVLNVTPVKECSCGAPYFKTSGKWPEKCTLPDCGALLEETEPTRLNRIQLLESGVRLFEQFNALEEAVPDDEGKYETENNCVPIQFFPIRLVSSGEGRNRTTTPVPLVSYVGPPNEESFMLSTGEKQEPFDIKEITKPYTAEQIIHLMNGGSVADFRESESEEDSEDEIPW